MNRQFSRTLISVMVGLALSELCYAYTFETESIRGSFDSTIGVGFGRRMQAQDCNMVGDQASSCGSSANTEQWSNGDNGNLNYNKGDFFSAYTKGTHELLLKLPENVSFMARGSWLYDAKATDTRRSDLSSDARQQIATDVRLLDLWVSKGFQIGEQSARVRLGNQVQNWGESIYGVGGINATNALDYQKLLVPGTLVKESILPAPMLSFSSSLGKGVSFDSYYQFRWNANKYPPVGTYFSVADVFGEGREPFYLNLPNFNFGGRDATSVAGSRKTSDIRAAQNNILAGNVSDVFGIPVIADDKPANGGQFGVAMHYKPEGISGDFGVYYLKYHDKAPVLNSLATAGFAEQWKYLANRELYGVSANGTIGNWAVGWELSYRPKDAVALSGCFGSGAQTDGLTNPPAGVVDCPQWTENKKYQMHLTGILSLTPGDHGPILNALGADSGTFTAEAVFIRYPGVDPNRRYVRTINGVTVTQVPDAGYFPWANNDSGLGYPIVAGVGTENSWGYTLDFNWTYDGKLLAGWQVTPGVTFFHAVKGDTPNFTANYLEGAKSANFYVLLNQNPTKWQAGLNYTNFFGGDNLRQPLRDRDFLGGFVSYSF